MMRTLNMVLKPLRRKVRQLVSRGVATLIDPNELMQVLQVELLKGEVLDDVEHFEGYGFTAHAPGEPEVLTASLNGQRSHTVAIAVANRIFRLKGLAKGEVAIYTDEGDVLHFKNGNEIYMNTANKLTVIATNQVDVTSPAVNIVASTKVTMTTPECEITGLLNVGGDITSGAQISDAAGSMQGMRDTYNGHGHPALNTPPTEKMT